MYKKSKIKVIVLISIIIILGISLIGILLLKFKKVKGMEEMKKMELIYRTGLSQYLVNELDLEKYDQELLHSDLNFIPHPEEKQRDAQKRDKLGLIYLYLRNDLHLEYLSKEEIESLQAELQNTDEEISDALLDIIIHTYKKVISLQKIQSEEDKKILTTFDNNGKHVEMNALVFRISTYEEYDENGYWVDQDHEVIKQSALKEFSKKMEEELEGKLGDTPIRVQLEFSLFSDSENGFLN